MSSVDDAFSGMKPKEGDSPAEKTPKQAEKPKFEGGKSLSETVKTPWLEKRPMDQEINALKKLSKSFNLILGNPL